MYCWCIRVCVNVKQTLIGRHIRIGNDCNEFNACTNYYSMFWGKRGYITKMYHTLSLIALVTSAGLCPQKMKSARKVLCVSGGNAKKFRWFSSLVLELFNLIFTMGKFRTQISRCNLAFYVAPLYLVRSQFRDYNRQK